METNKMKRNKRVRIGSSTKKSTAKLEVVSFNGQSTRPSQFSPTSRQATQETSRIAKAKEVMLQRPTTQKVPTKPRVMSAMVLSRVRGRSNLLNYLKGKGLLSKTGSC